MEASNYFNGGCNRAGTPQFAVEKQGKAGGEHFIVEDLLDLSNEEEEDDGMVAGEDGGSEAAAGFSSTESSSVTVVVSCSSSVSGCPDSHLSGELVCRSHDDVGLSGDLCEPYDDLAELEWLSNFVEDSFSSEDIQTPQLISGPKSFSSSESHGDGSASQPPQQPFFLQEAPVPGKARSKRSRVAPCNWSSRLLLLSSVPTTSSSDPNAAVIQPSPGKKPAKKDLSPSSSDGRKCLHCATDKTPQWRTGPMGPKTLCNACGVRYKSGRLVQEYRPAASPTFVLSKHSNSHRKVLELRRQKEMQQQQFLLGGAGAAVLYDGAASFAGDDFLIHRHLGPDYRQLI